MAAGLHGDMSEDVEEQKERPALCCRSFILFNRVVGWGLRPVWEMEIESRINNQL